ncbi:MAG: L,D-transpeptidase family protein [Nocardioidaceae bacterium]
MAALARVHKLRRRIYSGEAVVMSRRLVVVGALLSAAALVATGCTNAFTATEPRATPAADTASATATPASSSATPRHSATPDPTTSKRAAVSDPLDLGHKKIKYGQEGKHVKALQKRLTALHYDAGEVDGHYGPNTRYAVWAFDKVNGIKPHDAIGKKVRAAFDDPEQPKALEPGGAKDRVEIKLDKQYLVVYLDDTVALISHISTGSGASYCNKWTDDATGETGTSCGVAVTPTGNYKTYRRIEGWRHSRLGYLYNPVYFNGGIAVHGEPYVPLYPASHGCVRIPMHTSTIFPKLVDKGEMVYVRD